MLENKKENYHIVSLIGKGAYGEVYKARKKLTGQFVAIKTIRKKGKQEKDIKAMREEIEILKKLKHQNIVLLLDSFETNSEFIIVTQLGQGQLFNIIEDDQHLKESEIRKVAQQLIRALHYIHSNRITHRDLKPQNILMTSDGNIKLCDFGFARHMSYRTEVLTSLKGTPLYMAPEVVQEHPYTHTADLWSLGVILYELSTGSPPFSAPNLLTLVDHISKDPVRYPEVIQGDFKNLLKGLLNKDPSLRLGWPDLLNHPFIRETEQEKLERKKKSDIFSYWIEENHYSEEEENFSSISNINPASQSFNQVGGDERSRDISPKKVVAGGSATKVQSSCTDKKWNNYLKQVNEENGPTQLRSDAQFLNDLLDILSRNINDLMRNKQQKNILQVSLKVLTQVLMKSKTPSQKSLDISKKLNVPNYLLNILKNMLKVENGKNYIESISDITKLIGLLAKITFNKKLGIEMVYIRSFLPLLPSLITCLSASTSSQYQTLTINMLRTIGIFANNASVHHLRSFSFYKDIIEIKFIPDCVSIMKVYQPHINVLKLLVQVLSAFMHPVYGDIECFPWKRSNSYGVVEYKECSTMLDCVRQSIINSLLEVDWMNGFERVLEVEDESGVLPKISVERIILQAIRQSKQFTQNILCRANSILEYIFNTLTNTDPIIYGTTCLILSHLFKYSRERKKDKFFIDHNYLTNDVLRLILNKIHDYYSIKSNGMLGIYGSLVLLQELVHIQVVSVNKIHEAMMKEKTLKILGEYLGQSERNKLEQMRKLEGSNYGIHGMGYYDPVFILLHRLQLRLQKQGKSSSQLLMMVSHSQIQGKMGELMNKLSTKTDLSPRGMIAFLMLVYDIVSHHVSGEFAQPLFLKNLIKLLGETQIESLNEWPLCFGGGETCLQILFGNLMKIFLLYLQEAEKEVELIKAIYQSGLTELIIQFTRLLDAETINSLITFMVHLISFNNDKLPFIRQFIEASGMAIFVRFSLLKTDIYDNASIIQSCNLLSQIARSSKDTYEHIASIDLYPDLKVLIKHPDPQIKSRVLNLLGNMCRHSNYFYAKLLEFDFIKDIIHLCSSDDKNIKKFACVALGNASFHDASLYEELRAGVPVLVGLLKDIDEKTRSNAAAALGNLARNSGMLDKEFVRTGANYQLVNMINNDKSLSAKKVSIMAVTNLLNLEQSSKLLIQLNISTILKKYLPPAFTGDSTIAKTAQKALEKIKE